MFCPECGVDHHAADREATAAVDREVEIARINAKRDVDVARIGARMNREELEAAEEIAETQADAQVDTAVAEAEILGAAIENADAPPGELPAIIAAPDIDVDQSQEADPEELPPTEGSPAPEPAAPKSRGLGMW